MATISTSKSIYCCLIFSLSLFISASVFAYPSVQDLDQMWIDRQSPEGQKNIIKFIKKTEKIPNDFEISWRVARLVYFAGHFGIGKNTFDKKDQLIVFKYGSDAANIAKTVMPDRVEGYYWYATNLGSYGMVKGIFSALKYADDARNALITAVELDPQYHWAGPYRLLGRFYQAAPRFISFGDKKKAEDCFKKALELEPNFKLNIVNMAVFKKEQGDSELALKLLQKALKSPKLDGSTEENKYISELVRDIENLRIEEVE